MRVVCISDTHNRLSEIKVPDGDLLIHAGDGTMGGREHEIRQWGRDMRALPHQNKLVIPGNHDFGFQTRPMEAFAWFGDPESNDRTMTVLTHGPAEIQVGSRTLKVFGSAWTPWFHDWAFNGPQLGQPGRDFMAAKWAAIPEGLDILVTHGPPYMVRDDVCGENVGCKDLAYAVAQKRPKLHVFGHIHEGYGEVTVGGLRFVNASSLDAGYQPTNAPIVIDL